MKIISAYGFNKLYLTDAGRPIKGRPSFIKEIML